MGNNFRNINFGKLLFETLRGYFAVNSAGEMSVLYKYLSSFAQVFQAPFNSFVGFRTKEALIASCKWQIGQLTNVLNYLYDKALHRIYITQSVVSILADPMFQYAPVNFDSDFGTPPVLFERIFTDPVNQSLVSINIPGAVATTSLSDLTATLNQINLSGIPFQITQF
jgi:hypothetical protein